MNVNKKRFRQYMKKTIKNKIVALILIILGVLSVFIDGDGTFMIFAVAVSIALFFAKNNYIL